MTFFQRSPIYMNAAVRVLIYPAFKAYAMTQGYTRHIVLGQTNTNHHPPLRYCDMAMYVLRTTENDFMPCHTSRGNQLPEAASAR